jgi:hypothetical protein
MAVALMTWPVMTAPAEAFDDLDGPVADIVVPSPQAATKKAAVMATRTNPRERSGMRAPPGTGSIGKMCSPGSIASYNGKPDQIGGVRAWLWFVGRVRSAESGR